MAKGRKQRTPLRHVCVLCAEAMINSTAKDMPRTVAEVQACKAMITQQYLPQAGAPHTPELPAWPQLKPRPQLA